MTIVLIIYRIQKNLFQTTSCVILTRKFTYIEDSLCCSPFSVFSTNDSHDCSAREMFSLVFLLMKEFIHVYLLSSK